MNRIDATRLRRHVFDELLPLWWERGWDRERGGTHTRLSLDLEPLSDRDGFKRLVVQARQIYVYSFAVSQGASWAREAADLHYDFMREKFWDDTHGGWFLTTTPAGDPLDCTKDTYAQAFALLALAYYAQIGDASDARTLADTTLELLERHLTTPKRRGFLDGATPDWQPLLDPRRQNPHMHLFEALLAGAQSFGDAAYLERARAIFALLQSRLVDSRGCLLEYFADDWAPFPGERGRVVEPGHHFEWVWLLRQRPDLACQPQVEAVAGALFAFARAHGVDPADGAAFDQIDPDGKVTQDAKRVWPQTEHIKALGSEARRREDPAALEAMRAQIDLCFARYVRPDGGWNEQSTRSGTISSDHMKATTVYHVMTALLDAATVLDTFPERASI